MALPAAGAMGGSPGSPTPVGASWFTITTSTFGAPLEAGWGSHGSCLASPRPLRSRVSAMELSVRPYMIAPSIWARTTSGLPARPQSTAQNTQGTRMAIFHGYLGHLGHGGGEGADAPRSPGAAPAPGSNLPGFLGLGHHGGEAWLWSRWARRKATVLPGGLRRGRPWSLPWRRPCRSGPRSARR